MDSKKLEPSDKILIALQFWQGDKEQAMQLARLLADLEPKHCDRADLLLVSRFDCVVDQATVKHVARKFNTFSYISKRRGTGWPHGCNELFFGMLEWFYHKKEAGQIPNYKAVFAIEADGIPITPNWIARLNEEWDEINRNAKVYVAGAWLNDGPHGVGHINGNALFSGDTKFMTWLVRRVGGCNSDVGWDWIYAKDFKNWGWQPIPQIKSVWRTPITETIFKGEIEQGTVWYHGVKNQDGIKLCRKHFLGETY